MLGNSNHGSERRLQALGNGVDAPERAPEGRRLRVFNKICALRNTLDEIESWLDATSSDEGGLLVPSGFLTLDNLDVRMLAEGSQPAHRGAG